MFATVLYRARLVPRWIPALGLIGAPLLITSAGGIILGLHELGLAYSVVATVPIFVWELFGRPVDDLQGLQPELAHPRGRRRRGRRRSRGRRSSPRQP